MGVGAADAVIKQGHGTIRLFKNVGNVGTLDQRYGREVGGGAFVGTLPGVGFKIAKKKFAVGH